MASYRPYPPSSFPPPPPPNQNPLPPPPPNLQTYPPPNPYPPPANYATHFSAPTHHFNPPSSRNQQQQYHHHHPQQQQQQQQFQFPPPPPIHQPQPPQQHSMYYPSSHFPSSSQFNLPPPPSSPPPSLPPPPPSLPLPPPRPPITQTQPKPAPLPAPERPKPHQHRAPPHPPPKAEGGKIETEEERRARKRREHERQQKHLEGKRQLMMKQTQDTVLHKTANMRAHASLSGSRMADRRSTPFLSGDRIENRLKKPTTFLCKLKFRNDLPDPTAQPKLLAMNTNKDRYTKYAITSLEKMHKPKLYIEPDLGIPLDLLDLSVYNPPENCPPLAPEDEELLRDGDVATPVKQDSSIKKKDRPTDKGVSWLVKTQYISPLSMDSAKLSLTEKQAKEMRETREGRNLFLENLNNREKQIQAIEESFKASKLPPVHQTNPNLKPEKIMPLFPDFDRKDDPLVMVTFDGDPTADSEAYNKLDRSARDEYEAQAIMKSFVVNGSDPTKPEKFLAYMVPASDEMSKEDMDDENEDVPYSWVREYHWDVRGDDADDPTTYLVNFDEEEEVARYLPLPTKLVLQKKKAKEGRCGDEMEHFPVPSRITVRRTTTDAGGSSNHV